MAVKGIERVQAGFLKITDEIDKNKTGAAVHAVLTEGAAAALFITPVDSSTLANSQYSPQIEYSSGETTGYVGYTAKYAGWVHQMPGTLKGLPRKHFGKTGNQSAFGPQQRVEFGGGTGTGNYWDTNGEPQFLTKGFAEIEPKIPSILERMYRV